MWQQTNMSVYEFLTAINVKATISENSSQRNNRLLAGILLNDIVERTVMASKNNVTAPGKKMTLYSTVCMCAILLLSYLLQHEGTVGALMNNMGNTLNDSLPYAVAFMIDLYSISNTYYVQVCTHTNTHTKYY
jgi:hypothetical protein